MISEVMVRRMSSRLRGGKKAERAGSADGRPVVKTKQRTLKRRAQTFGLLGWALGPARRALAQRRATPMPMT